jgi:hypothetical protein
MNANAGQAPPAPDGYATFDHNPLVTPGTPMQPPVPDAVTSTQEEQELLKKIKAEKERPNPMHSHLRTIDPKGIRKQSSKSEQPPVTAQPDPAILELANNDDLNVATLARQANKARKKEPPQDEVVISLR